MAVDDSLLNEMTVEQARGWLARRNRNRDERARDRFALTHSINEDGRLFSSKFCHETKTLLDDNEMLDTVFAIDLVRRLPLVDD